MTIAAFDCDGTLIRGDATRRFLLELRGPSGLAIDLLALAPLLLAWRLGRCSTAALKQALLDQALQNTPVPGRQAALERLKQVLVRQIRPQALNRLRWHQQQGHRCLIVSASPEPLLTPLARHLGVELLATGCTDPLEVRPDHPLRLTTPNCKGPEKLIRLEQHLGGLPAPEHLEAYGDSRGDRDLLQASGRPHWRSFADTPVAYREARLGRWLLAGASLLLLVLVAIGLSRLDPMAQRRLITASSRLLGWLPALYGLLAIAYIGRYLRWRLLLGSCGVGRWCWADAMAWFQGFSLTATPGKLGELSRVQQLHSQLGYPRLPLLHAFLAERFCDAAAVIVWLAALLPRSLPGHRAGAWLVPIGLVSALLAWLLRRPIQRRWQQWRHHLPRGAMVRAILPGWLASLAFWGCEGLLLWVLVGALAPPGLSAMAAIGIYLLSGTAGMASSLPGGIGVNEAATVLLLSQQGIPASVALPIAVLRRLITPWSVVALAAALAVLPAAGPVQTRQD